METRKPIFLSIFAAAVGLFLILPGLMVIPMSFNGQRTMSFPPSSWGLRWYENFFSNQQWTQSLVNSLLTSTFSALLATILGTMAAFALLRYQFPGKSLLTVLILAPLATPIVIIGLGDYSLFLTWHLTGTPQGFILAYTVIAIPYVVITVSASLVAVKAQYEQAASTLGANPLVVFFKITVPLMLPGMLAGFIFAFVTAFDETVIALFLSEPGFRTLPVMLYSSMTREIDPTIAAASSIIMLLTTLALVLYVAVSSSRRSLKK